MTENDREKIALFRYGLISPILNGQVKNQKEYLQKESTKVHNVPYYGSKEYVPKTIYGWLRAYRRGGFDALKPKHCSDRRRFSFDIVNKMWQGDLSYGPWLNINGKKKRSYLLAFIDDYLWKVLDYGKLTIKILDIIVFLFTLLSIVYYVFLPYLKILGGKNCEAEKH